MPIPESTATQIRGYFTKIQAYLKTAPLSDLVPVRHLAYALYEYNRGSHVSAIRPQDTASESQLREDALENVRLLLESNLGLAIDAESEEHALAAAREFCQMVISAASDTRAVN